MKRVGIVFLLLLWVVGLAGCSKRELEDRSFPSVLLVVDGNLEETIRKQQEESSLFLDFGHTKAVLMAPEVLRDREQFKETLLYLEHRPDFARNLLVFCADEKVRQAAEENQREAGFLLEDLYNNQPKEQSRKGVTLQDALNYLHNRENRLEIPCLELKGEDFIRDGSEVLTWEEQGQDAV